jgi:hypothetical protein
LPRVSYFTLRARGVRLARLSAGACHGWRNRHGTERRAVCRLSARESPPG